MATPIEEGAEVAADPAGTDRPDVLYLVHRVPYPPDKGDRIRAYHLLKFLSHRARVHLACLADEPVDEAAVSALQRLCDGLEIVPLAPHRRWLHAFGSLACGRTATEGAFASPRLRATLRHWVGRTHFRAAIVSASSMVPYLRTEALRRIPAVVDLVDVDSQKWLDLAADDTGMKSWLYHIEGIRLRRLEKSLTQWAHAVTLVSQVEADLYREISIDGVVKVATNGVDLTTFRPAADRRSRCFVFVGALDYRPNIEGVRWLSQEVWPKILSRTPDLKLQIVGRRPVPAVERLDRLPGVEVVGQVPDVRPFIVDATAVVAPLKIARGIQNKVLEAFAMAKPVVASSQALDGLGAESGVHLLTAETPDDWVDAILRLQGDAGLRRRLGDAGRRYVEQHHDWDRCLAPFEGLLS